MGVADKAYPKSGEFERCRVCGCTNDVACPGGCYWVEPDLCSECLELCAMLFVDFGASDRAPAAIVAVGYGLAAERAAAANVFGDLDDPQLLEQLDELVAEGGW